MSRLDEIERRLALRKEHYEYQIDRSEQRSVCNDIDYLLAIARSGKALAEAWYEMRTYWRTRGFSGQSAMIDAVNEAYDKLQAALKGDGDGNA